MSLKDVSAKEALVEPKEQLLVEENKRQLDWLELLLNQLRPQDYSRSDAYSGASAISSHVRHVLNHYDLFLQACQLHTSQDTLNYEARTRNHPAEKNIDAAKYWLATIRKTMNSANLNEKKPLKLKECAGQVEVLSSVGREMAFLYSHTAHHLALIKQQAVQLGYELAESFGVHPSTLRAQANQKVQPIQAKGKACAR
ncbi:MULTISPECIES: hypothetical protein [Gammaproteobacteria]|uniref:hypothetical protein n=1 Tax=Gammaproteobacteria TaxID=1236 RepID=UPI000DD017D7|nr:MULTISPECIES: hypothetical protein [Gammaproteobacteria]RTE85896.1 hypothetical protein DQX04_10650 [Aliidiomarina sp. B3213]TCZ90104.1 hypothetical protein EYQ95_09815 [Lysobacter sp. N42]